MESFSELFGSYTCFISTSSKSTLATISVSGLPLSNLPRPACVKRRHRADRQVGGFGVDQVDFGMLWSRGP